MPPKPRQKRNKRQVVENAIVKEVENDIFNMNLKESSSSRTGLVFDERMVQHKCLFDPSYPERPERFSLSLQRCRDYGLVDRCHLLSPRSATKDELLLDHSLAYVEFMEKTKHSDAEYLCSLSTKYDAVYFHPTTYDLSLLSVGCAVDLVSDVVSGKLKNGMAIIRPPGHHAMNDKACGYCYFNNIAIATKHALNNLGLQRILIVDWDVHHGQATQYSFYDDPRVLYFSIHRYEHGLMWPNLRESDYDYVGSGRGKGFNVNVPLNKVGLGNSEYLAVFQQILLPIAYEFSPELIIVSAGFDAALGCPEGEMKVTPACYAHFTSMLMSLAGGKVCVVLEGGYCLKSLSEGVALTLRALLGDPCPRLEAIGEPDSSAIESILNVISVQRLYWKSLKSQGVFYGKSGNNLIEDNDWPLHNPVLLYRGVPPCEPFPSSGFYPTQSEDEICLYAAQLDHLISTTSLSFPHQRTCIAFDRKMAEHRNLHESHPEKPERLISILSCLEETGLLDRCKILKPRKVTEEELLSYHSKEYLEAMKDSENMKLRDLLRFSEKFRSIYLCQESYQSALLAAGCALQVVDEVMTEKSLNGVAVIRPPGHHAESDEACGFCIFNNVVVATKYALSKYGLKRILIVDWDVHHGNGIQNAFYDDERVLYITIHRYNNGGFFPASVEANYNYVGRGKGQGFNINIPWNTVGLSDGDYLAAFCQVVLPVAYQFDPELVFISAGFDAAKGDFIGNCKVSPVGYAIMAQLLSSLAAGKLILALEGGYNLRALAVSFAMCVKVFLGDAFVSPSPGLVPCHSAVHSINNTILEHKRFWSSLKYQVNLPCSEQEHGETNADNVEGACGGVVDEDVVSSLADSLIDLKVTGDDVEGCSAFAVVPKTDCPHLGSIRSLANSLEPDDFTQCFSCGSSQENWLCLTCHEVFCARYINGHMLEHFEQLHSHCVALSFSDLSTWCYLCDSYVHDENIIDPIKDKVHLKKFGVLPPKAST